MNSRLRSTLIACTLLLGLAACSDDDGISSSNAGTSAGDGGAGSAQYAGTYKGTMDVEYEGDDIKGDDTLPVTIIIHDNGTVTMKMEGESVGGVISDNKLEIAFTIKESQDGITCKGDALVKAAVSGTSLSGPVKGDAECKLGLIEQTADLIGVINARKT